MNNKTDSHPQNEDLQWKTGKKTLLSTTPIFTVYNQKSVSPKGNEKNFITIDAPDWVITVPILRQKEAQRFTGIAKDSFLIVEQWRHGAACLSMEFPGGVIDKGECPEDAAQRELTEETGFKAKKLVALGSMNPNPAVFCNTVHFFAAKELIDTKHKNPDEDEFLKTHIIPVEEVIKKTGRPPYIHALMAAALCLYKYYEKNEPPTAEDFVLRT